ncbi:MAG: hypothetical protein JWM74_4532 [Myxococcaceae bacterium]|jgi:hypothetical protein|nr:hypothetical protein [Myxococcaceae bacterium]
MKNEDNDTLLPSELVWEEGHLTEIARTAIADGQDAIVPPDAVAHLTTCASCMHAMGDAALLSSHVAEVIASMSPDAAPISSRAAAPFPVAAIAAAVVVAALGALPALVDLPLWVGQASIFLTHTLPQLFKAGIAVVKHTHGVAPVVTFASTTLLLMAGFAVARAVPQKLSPT